MKKTMADYTTDLNKDAITEEMQRSIVAALMEQEYEDVILINPETGEPTILIHDGKSTVYEEQRKVKDFNKGLENYFLKMSADDNPQEAAKVASLETVKEALKKQDIYTISYSVYDLNQKIIRKRASYSYLDKKQEAILCKMQDITADFEKEVAQREALQEALRQAQKANDAKTEFFSRMSHDMRTPMNGILGLAELSEQEMDPEILKKNIAQMKEAGQYLLSLINDTLDFQKIESGKMVLDPKLVVAEDVFANIVSLIQLEAEKKGVTFRVKNSNADLGWNIRIDPVRIKQIFINLLSNAVKFTPPGGTVEMAFWMVKREGMISHDVVTITDTGIGMSREFLENGIFKPFSQENNEVTSIYAGSGLGLSIVKRLVELMGGTIEVESELGVGTKFTLHLNFERVDIVEAVKAKDESGNYMSDVMKMLKNKKILLAEDHPLNAEIAIRILEHAGCKVTWVKNGQECTQEFMKSAENTFDMILMDIRMPIMDGLQAAKTIRDMQREDVRRIPILAMTANAYEEDVEKSMEAGMNEHIAKPIVPGQLYETMSRYF